MSALTETYRAHYSTYINDVTGSPKTTVKSVHTGLSQLNNPFLNRQNQGSQQTGIMPHYGGGAEKCARCLKNVYLAEKKVGAGRSFHSSCFSCQTCNRKLDATTLSEHKGEIFCKTCYTRQFGVHGLVSGVTMTTEQPIKEIRHSRRSSYGSDLDAPVITHQQTRQRAHSNDNHLRGETSAIQHDEVPKMFPWRNDVLPEQRSPIKNGIENLVDKQQQQQQQRPISQIGFEKIIESKTTTSAIVDMPIVSPPKKTDIIIEPIQMPKVPIITQQRSRSPSTDIYQRESSYEHQSDIAENFARLTLTEVNTILHKNENSITNKIASVNPIIKQTYSHESSPEPTSGYGSSSVHDEGISRESTSSPPSAYVPQHKSNSNNTTPADRRASSPSPVKKSTLPSPPQNGGKYSTIAALIKPHRPLSQLSTPNDDEYDN